MGVATSTHRNGSRMATKLLEGAITVIAKSGSPLHFISEVDWQLNESHSFHSSLGLCLSRDPLATRTLSREYRYVVDQKS